MARVDAEGSADLESGENSRGVVGWRVQLRCWSGTCPSASYGFVWLGLT